MIVTSAITLTKLHRVILAAISWRDVHPHEFEIAGHRYGVPDSEFPEAALINESRVTLAVYLSAAATSASFADKCCPVPPKAT